MPALIRFACSSDALRLFSHVAPLRNCASVLRPHSSGFSCVVLPIGAGGCEASELVSDGFIVPLGYDWCGVSRVSATFSQAVFVSRLVNGRPINFKNSARILDWQASGQGLTRDRPAPDVAVRRTSSSVRSPDASPRSLSLRPRSRAAAKLRKLSVVGFAPGGLSRGRSRVGRNRRSPLSPSCKDSRSSISPEMAGVAKPPSREPSFLHGVPSLGRAGRSEAPGGAGHTPSISGLAKPRRSCLPPAAHRHGRFSVEVAGNPFEDENPGRQSGYKTGITNDSSPTVRRSPKGSGIRFHRENPVPEF